MPISSHGQAILPNISHPSPNNHGKLVVAGTKRKGVLPALSDYYNEPDLNLESKPSHAGLVLLNGRFAFLRRVFGLREEHAVVAGSLFGFAHTAGLYINYNISVKIFFCRFCLL